MNAYYLYFVSTMKTDISIIETYCSLKFCSKVEGTQFKFQFSLVADIFAKSDQKCIFLTDIVTESDKVDKLRPKL